MRFKKFPLLSDASVSRCPLCDIFLHGRKKKHFSTSSNVVFFYFFCMLCLRHRWISQNTLLMFPHMALTWPSDFSCHLNSLSMNFFQLEYPPCDVSGVSAALGSEKCLHAKQYAESQLCEEKISHLCCLYHVSLKSLFLSPCTVQWKTNLIVRIEVEYPVVSIYPQVSH